MFGLPNNFFFCLAFLLLCLSLWFWSARAQVAVRTMVRLFLFAWITNSSVLLIGLIIYGQVFTFLTFSYLSAFVIAFVLGLYASQWGVEKNLTYFGTVKPINKATFLFLMLLSLGYIALSGVDILIMSPKIFSSFSSLRSEQWDKYVSKDSISGIDSLVAIFKAGAFVFSCMILGSSQSKRIHKLIAIGIVSIIVLGLLLQAGRSVIFFLVFTIAFIRITYGNEKRKTKNYNLKKVSFFIIGALSIYFMLVIYPTLRNQTEYTDYDLYLSYRHDGEISKWVKKVNEYVPNFSELAFSSAYLSQPIVKMTDFIENLGVSKWYTFGAYSFSVPIKIYTLFGGENIHQKTRLRLEEAVRAQGYLAVRPWATSAADIAVDFGILGGVCASFLISLILGRLYFVGLKMRSLEGGVICGLIALNIILFPFKSPMNITIIANSLVISLFLYFTSKLRIYSKKHRPI